MTTATKSKPYLLTLSPRITLHPLPLAYGDYVSCIFQEPFLPLNYGKPRPKNPLRRHFNDLQLITRSHCVFALLPPTL